MKKFIPTLIGLILFYNSFSFSQGNASKISIQNESLDAYPIGFPLYVKLWAVDSNAVLDSNYNQLVTVSIDSGSVGNLNGGASILFVNGIAIFSSISIDAMGQYKLKFVSGSLQDATSSTFTVTGGLPQGAGPTTSLHVFEYPTSVASDSLFNVIVFAKNSSQNIDTTNNDSVIIKNNSYPTDLSGYTQVRLNKGIGLLFDLSIHTNDTNQLICSLANTSFTDVINVVVTGNSTSTLCDSNKYSTKNNLGIYGGAALDLHFSYASNRLFIGTQTPYSLFYSDDTAATWKQSFPYDSLLFNCDQEAWAGGAAQILSNSKGWIATLTQYENITSSQISFNNGDSGTFKTAIDGYLLSQYGYGDGDISCIALNDYEMLTAIGSKIIITDNSSFNPSTDIIDLKTKLIGNPSNLTIKKIAMVNSSSLLSFYAITDTLSNDVNSTSNQLSLYDGFKLTPLSGLPSTIKILKNVFTHPDQITSDTLFITGSDGFNNSYIYSSYNGGSTWSDISFNNNELTDLEYNPSWTSVLSQSKGAILITRNAGLSKDYGASWDSIANGSMLSSVGPTVYSSSNLNVIVGNNATGALVSKTGTSGTFENSGNIGLEAIQINDIAKGSNKSFFYIATDAGLAYTTEYKNTNIASSDKWKSPYGIFPINNVADDVTAVAVSPLDSLHVIAGGQLGFYVSTSGPVGFTKIVPSGFFPGVDMQDIKFVDDSIIIAIRGVDVEKGSSTIYGEIWRSADGGLNWTNVSPSNFYSGMCLAVAESNKDTVIYAGTQLAYTDTGYLWQSNDLGINWTKVNMGPSSQYNFTAKGMGISDLAVYPGSIDTLYLVASNNSNAVLAKSIDGGLSYSILNSNEELGKAKALEIYDYSEDTVLASFGNDIYMYADQAKTFVQILKGLPGEEQNAIESGSILVGTTLGFFIINLEPIEDIVTTIAKQTNNTQTFIIYPNPTSEQATLELYLTEKSTCSISIYDLYGKKLKDIITLKTLPKGNYSYLFSTDSYSKGIYFIKATIKETNYIIKLIKN